MIAVIDYGMGNLRSVHKGCERVGLPARITSDPDDLRSAGALILPGVGAFGAATANLRQAGLFDVILAEVAAGKPLLGICLGMQLLFEVSHEDGLHRGLGLLEGQVRRLPSGVKVPHMGWNSLEFTRPSPLWDGLAPGSYVYFVHSFYADPASADDVIAAATHGISFAAAVQRGLVYGTQFHPEKSSANGLAILAAFGRAAGYGDRIRVSAATSPGSGPASAFGADQPAGRREPGR
ncbi:MAG: imidazole glycerol phosphate synthase subunit HisH [Firmicutes bacterium]|nr:imidazole glycerol phosphate synthase subunit HisH [Bacillota bacterium]